MSPPLLAVDNLRVDLAGGVQALRGVTFGLNAGDTLAVVGESGAGKSTLAHALLGALQPPLARGSVQVAGHELLGASDPLLRSLRWSTVALVPQSSALNPVSRVGHQITEPLSAQGRTPPAAARVRAEALAQEVGLDVGLLERYPHELSGGQLRRVMLAMALVLDPALVILDEPTVGLDPAGRADLLDRVVALARNRGFGMLVATHDLPAAVRLTDRCLMLYAGEVIESAATRALVGRPAHPYSRALLSAYPVMSTTKDLRPIRGRAPDPRAVPTGCAFHPRCTQAVAACADRRPLLEPARGRLVACHFGGTTTLLSASTVSKTFGSGARRVRALDNVTFAVEHGESVGVVGQSGSGKSTLARVLSGHLAPDSGEVRLEGETFPTSWSRPARQLRRRVQLVMQNPWQALSPRLTVRELVREPLDVAGEGDRSGCGQLVDEMLDAVGLPTSSAFTSSRVDQLSGGQLQRVALARAVIARPQVLVADEPTSMLDASEQARLLLVLRGLQVDRGLGLVLVSHDIAVVRKVTDRIVVLDAGRVVEVGSSESVSGSPRTEAARRIVTAAPVLPSFDDRHDTTREPDRS